VQSTRFANALQNKSVKSGYFRVVGASYLLRAGSNPLTGYKKAPLPTGEEL